MTVPTLRNSGSNGGAPLLRARALRTAHAGPFSLDIACGECVAILGPSGSGKSAFLRMLADLDPASGEVTLDGRQREQWPAPLWRRSVLYQAAEPAWWDERVAAHFEAADRMALSGLLPRIGLDPSVLDAEPARLSTGERQRLALLRSLAPRPRVLLLDEPTASLDEDSTAKVEALLREQLDAGLALVLVTHSRAQAGRLGTRCFCIENGELKPL